jgi:hypothetical protein
VGLEACATQATSSGVGAQTFVAPPAANLNPGPQARAGIGQALEGRRSDLEDGYCGVSRSPRRRGFTLPSRGAPRSTWRHGVSFQHTLHVSDPRLGNGSSDTDLCPSLGSEPQG